MKRSRLFIAVFALAIAAAAAGGQAPFYTSMLDRGIGDVTHGNYKDGIQELRIAAFGFLNDIPRYQTAQAYIAIASSKLKNHEDARIAVTKLLNSERIQPTYARLNLAADARTQLEAMLPSIVTPVELALLKRAVETPSVTKVAMAPIPHAIQTPSPVASVVATRETVKPAPAPAKVAAVVAPKPAPAKVATVAAPMCPQGVRR